MDTNVAMADEWPSALKTATGTAHEPAGGVTISPNSRLLDLTLTNAEYLLNYAVEAGIAVEPDITQRIIAARRLGDAVWDSPDAGALVSAITKLAGKLHPVTAETLRGCREDADDAISSYKKIVFWLAAFIIPLSVVSFIYTAISNSITAELKIANELAVTLHTQLDPSATAEPSQSAPPGALAELQRFAATTRAVYSRTRQLNVLIFGICGDPSYRADESRAEHDKRLSDEMQLPIDLPNKTRELQTQINQKTQTYQNVRLYANSAQDASAIFWGAISTCILPMLYALLGACAYVLRAFTEQIERRTFAPSYATPARFIIAGIGGGVVGLFNNFTVGQGVSLPPLALAFLIGYAADIFFSFLEGSMRNLRGGKARQGT
jgi:hypothetical protein